MNRVVHFEISAPDPGAARAFYEKVFNWKISKWEGPADYWLCTTGEGGEGIDGAIVPSPDGTARVVNTLQVQSVDEFAARVTANGGAVVVARHAVPGVGWVAYCTDPAGVPFGIYESDPEAA